MAENSEQNSRSTMEVILGFLLGVLLSLGCLFLTIFLGITISPAHRWVVPFLNGIGLLGAGIIACRRMRESSYALGMVIALSFAFLLNAAGAAYYH
jgi:hypothetical protein